MTDTCTACLAQSLHQHLGTQVQGGQPASYGTPAGQSEDAEIKLSSYLLVTDKLVNLLPCLLLPLAPTTSSRLDMLYGIGGRAEHLLHTTDGAGHHARLVHLHVVLQHVLDVLPVATGVVKHLAALRTVDGSADPTPVVRLVMGHFSFLKNNNYTRKLLEG